jgi:hypothetical protein
MERQSILLDCGHTQKRPGQPRSTARSPRAIDSETPRFASPRPRFNLRPRQRDPASLRKLFRATRLSFLLLPLSCPRALNVTRKAR